MIQKKTKSGELEEQEESIEIDDIKKKITRRHFREQREQI